VSPVHATSDLIDVLLERARDQEPQQVTVPLATTPAGQLDVGLDPEVPIFTHFYWPTESSVDAVFGVDLSTPLARTSGRFLSHPDGEAEPTVTDDLHSALLVAVPPWEPDDVRAYDQHGPTDLSIHDVELPPEHVEE